MIKANLHQPIVRLLSALFIGVALILSFSIIDSQNTTKVLADQGGHSHLRFAHINWESKLTKTAIPMAVLGISPGSPYLEIKERTVRFYVENILDKLGVKNRTEAAWYAFKPVDIARGV